MNALLQDETGLRDYGTRAVLLRRSGPGRDRILRHRWLWPGPLLRQETDLRDCGNPAANQQHKMDHRRRLTQPATEALPHAA